LALSAPDDRRNACHIRIIEFHSSGRSELKNDATPATAAPELFDREMDRPIMNFKGEGQSHLAEVRVYGLDPFPEPVRVKTVHIPNENGMDELTNDFALAFGGRMQTLHASLKSRKNALISWSMGLLPVTAEARLAGRGRFRSTGVSGAIGEFHLERTGRSAR
jgi:hypothetical protein